MTHLRPNVAVEIPGAVGLPEVGGDAGDDAGWRGVAGPDEERGPEERRAVGVAVAQRMR